MGKMGKQGDNVGIKQLESSESPVGPWDNLGGNKQGKGFFSPFLLGLAEGKDEVVADMHVVRTRIEEWADVGQPFFDADGQQGAVVQLKRAADNSRRIRGTGFLFDTNSSHAYKNVQLPENLHIQSIHCGSRYPLKQQKEADSNDSYATAITAQQQLLSQWADSRDQMRATGMVLAMGTGTLRPLRTAERAVLRAQRLREKFAENPNALSPQSHMERLKLFENYRLENYLARQYEAKADGKVEGVRSDKVMKESTAAQDAARRGRAPVQEQYARWGWPQCTPPSMPSRGATPADISPHGARLVKTGWLDWHATSSQEKSGIEGKEEAGQRSPETSLSPPSNEDQEMRGKRAMTSCRGNRSLAASLESGAGRSKSVIPQNVSRTLSGDSNPGIHAQLMQKYREYQQKDTDIFDMNSDERDESQSWNDSLTTAAGRERVREDTFSSRKKKRGTGPLFKNADERVSISSRHSPSEVAIRSDFRPPSELERLNLNEAPVDWMLKREVRAARKEEEKEGLILGYNEPLPPGNKRIFFQNPYLSKISTPGGKSRCVLVTDKRQVYSAMAMHNTQNTHQIDLNDPTPEFSARAQWPIRRFHQRILSPRRSPRRSPRASIACSSMFQQGTSASTDSKKASLLRLDCDVQGQHTTRAFIMTKVRARKTKSVLVPFDGDDDDQMEREQFTRGIGLLQTSGGTIYEENLQFKNSTRHQIPLNAQVRTAMEERKEGACQGDDVKQGVQEERSSNVGSKLSLQHLLFDDTPDVSTVESRSESPTNSVFPSDEGVPYI
jgi:hypothetical protein